MEVTGILAQGHGEGAYAHYEISLWPRDSNHTISSLCKVLQALEKLHVCESKLLFLYPPANDCFDVGETSLPNIDSTFKRKFCLS